MSTELNMDMRALPGANALARAAALAAAAALPDPDPVPTVAYRSQGRVLITGTPAEVARWQERMAPPLVPSVLPVRLGDEVAIAGHLGAFQVQWRNGSALMEGDFDLILDLCDPPLLSRHTLPHGYYAPGADEAAREAALAELSGMTGTFEKPKYFSYSERRCAHSRNRQTGCTACIDICSARAIRSGGDRIVVDPHLCAGCGACGTVCPSGAISYAYPSPAYTGERLRTLLAAYASAGGTAPVIMFHGESARELVEGYPLPDHVIPVELQHAASCGIDVWLSAIAYGAAGVMVLTTASDAPQYRAALREQAGHAQAVLDALGYAGPHLHIAHGVPDQFPRGEGPAVAARFRIIADKRNTLDFALTHLHEQAPLKPFHVALAAGAPFGAVQVDTGKCTLCMSCVGACPASALQDSTTVPRLSFIEKNCVQCGLCESTCPENAVTLVPRLSFADSRNAAVTLNETEPFACISCGKEFGTLLMVRNMMARLSGHSAFAQHPERLKMCGDCRVIAMMRDSAPVLPVRREGA
ncbi:MAG TPA: 4Fe-4S binding protein [Telluria sp.]|nr:4Fe-4S binding protein [Telluria sp.]